MAMLTKSQLAETGSGFSEMGVGEVAKAREIDDNYIAEKNAAPVPRPLNFRTNRVPPAVKSTAGVS